MWVVSRKTTQEPGEEGGGAVAGCAARAPIAITAPNPATKQRSNARPFIAAERRALTPEVCAIVARHAGGTHAGDDAPCIAHKG